MDFFTRISMVTALALQHMRIGDSEKFGKLLLHIHIYVCVYEEVSAEFLHQLIACLCFSRLCIKVASSSWHDRPPVP